MKAYRLLIFIIFIFLSGYIYSQRFGGGADAGITFSQIDGDKLSGYNKLGFSGGFFVNTKINNSLVGQLEIKYIEKGASTHFQITNPVISVITLKYIEFPFIIRYKFDFHQKYKRYSIMAGPYLGVLFAETGRDESGRVDPQNLLQYHKLDFGGIIGAQYKITEKLNFDFRYSYSLIRTYKIPGGSPGGPWYFRGHYNNVINFSLYFQIV
jgi:opacity protein-like surface antigen